MNTHTLTQHLADYIAHIEAIHQSPVHRRQLRFGVLRTLRWLEETHGVVRAEQLSGVHLDGWFRHVSTRHTRKGFPLKVTSVSKQGQCDRAFFGWLAQRGILPASICEALPQVKLPHTLPTSVLTHAQMVRLLDKADTQTPMANQFRTMMELLYTSGMRIAELLALDVVAPDLDHGLIRVLGKGQKERMVPIGATACRFLYNYIKCIRPMLQREVGQTALFLDEAGHRMPYHTFRRLLGSVVEKSEIHVNITAHTIRRSCATEMIRGGAGLWIVGEQLGHTNVETLKHYIKLTAVDLKKSHAKHHPRERDRDAR